MPTAFRGWRARPWRTPTSSAVISTSTNRVSARGWPDTTTRPCQLAGRLAAPRGFEPRFTDSKSAVLPLDEGAAAGLVGAARRAPGKKMERKTGLEPATL